jgi:serine/threonine-protein kinase RsbW
MVGTQRGLYRANSTPRQEWRPVQRRANVASIADMDQVIEAVLDEMAALGYGERDVFCVRLSLEEAVTNALEHGNHYDPEKAVVVTWQVDEAQVLTSVEDQGPGFEPWRIADPCSAEGVKRLSGRGVLLMCHYLSWLCYNERGNRVTLCKYRTVS